MAVSPWFRPFDESCAAEGWSLSPLSACIPAWATAECQNRREVSGKLWAEVRHLDCKQARKAERHAAFKSKSSKKTRKKTDRSLQLLVPSWPKKKKKRKMGRMDISSFMTYILKQWLTHCGRSNRQKNKNHLSSRFLLSKHQNYMEVRWPNKCLAGPLLEGLTPVTEPLTAGRRAQVLWSNLFTDWKPWE